MARARTGGIDANQIMYSKFILNAAKLPEKLGNRVSGSLAVCRLKTVNLIDLQYYMKQFLRRDYRFVFDRVTIFNIHIL